MDNAIPVVLLVTVVGYMTGAIPNFLSLGNLADTSRQIGEFGLIVIGMTVVMLAGGIDLSVGSDLCVRQFHGSRADQRRQMADRGRHCRDDKRRRRWSA